MSRFLKIDELVDTISEYVKIRFDIIRLNVIEEISSIVAHLIALFLLLTVFLFFLAFGSVALAAWLNHLWSSPYLGYLLLSGLYLLAMLLFVYLLRSGVLKQLIEYQINISSTKRERALSEKIQKNK